MSPALTTDSDGLVSFSSSNIEVATVDNKTGKVSIVGAGETVITANIAETSEFEPGEASYILVVLDSGLVLYPPLHMISAQRIYCHMKLLMSIATEIPGS